MLGLLLGAGKFALRHPFLTGTVAHVATDGKSTELAMDAAKPVMDKGMEIAGDQLAGPIMERMGIPTDALAALTGGMDGLQDKLKGMWGGLGEQIESLLKVLVSFLVEALGGLVDTLVPNAHAAYAPTGAKAEGPQAIIQGTGRLAADLAASTAGLDPTTAEGRNAMNRDEVFRVPHDGSTDIVKTPVGEMTSPARAEREAAFQQQQQAKAPDTALGNRGLSMDDVTF